MLSAGTGLQTQFLCHWPHYGSSFWKRAKPIRLIYQRPINSHGIGETFCLYHPDLIWISFPGRMQCVMKSPCHCWCAASDVGDNSLQITIPFYVLVATLCKIHTKQDVGSPCCTSSRSSSWWWAVSFTNMGKESCTQLASGRNFRESSFAVLQNIKPQSNRPEGRGASSSASPVLDCSNRIWPYFLFIPGVLYMPRGFPPLLWETTNFC